MLHVRRAFDGFAFLWNNNKRVEKVALLMSIILDVTSQVLGSEEDARKFVRSIGNERWKKIHSKFPKLKVKFRTFCADRSFLRRAGKRLYDRDDWGAAHIVKAFQNLGEKAGLLEIGNWIENASSKGLGKRMARFVGSFLLHCF